MPKRWQGGSGRYEWLAPAAPFSPPPAPGPPVPPPSPPPPAAPVPAPPQGPGLRLLPRLLGELETEDLILLLLCWLLYRESGDSDWLIVLGALMLG